MKPWLNVGGVWLHDWTPDDMMKNGARGRGHIFKPNDHQAVNGEMLSLRFHICVSASLLKKLLKDFRREI